MKLTDYVKSYPRRQPGRKSKPNIEEKEKAGGLSHLHGEAFRKEWDRIWKLKLKPL